MWYPVLIVAVLLTPHGQEVEKVTEEAELKVLSGVETKELCEYAATWAAAAANMTRNRAPKSIEVTCERREGA